MNFNIEKAKQLRDHFAQVPDETINMDKWLDGPLWRRPEMDCGSAGCLLGHSAYLWPDEVRVVENYGSPEIEHIESLYIGYGCMAQLLSISTRDAEILCAPRRTPIDYSLGLCSEPETWPNVIVNRDIALARLDYLIENDGMFS